MLISNPTENNCLEGKRALVIDDMGAAVAIGRNMLMGLGARQVDTATDYKGAFPLIAKKHYDLVLCDFNLGSGLNGQQLLRDLRHIKRISYQTLFIVVSAERTKDIVLGTIECEPDGYITKPFTQKDFRSRIVKMVEQSEVFKATNQALDDGDVERAIGLLDEVITQRRPFRMLALRKKAGTLYEHKRYKEAMEVFDDAQYERNVTWAAIGHARCLAELGYLDRAISELSEVVRTNPLAVPAMDSLADCHLRKGEKKQAQAVLIDSLKLSPMGLERQRWLGDLSVDLGDMETGLRAYDRMLTLAVGTLKENTGLHDTYLRTLRKSIESETDSKRINEMISDGRQRIKDTRKRFEDEELLKYNDALLRALDQHQQKNQEEAIAIIDAAMERHKDLLAADPERVIDVAETKFHTGDQPGGELILRKLMKDYPDDKRLQDRIQAILDTPIPFHKRMRLNELNRQGKQEYDAGNYELALKAFREALQVYPQHPAVNLNAVQVMLKLIDMGKRTSSAYREATQYVNACVHLEPEHPEFKRKRAFSRFLFKQTE